MTTRLDVVEKLIDRAEAYATDHKWPGHADIQATRQQIRKKYGTEFLALEIQHKCELPLDNGHLADYIDKEFLTRKASAILNGTAAPGSAMANWVPTAEDKAFAADIITKIIKVMRS